MNQIVKRWDGVQPLCMEMRAELIRLCSLNAVAQKRRKLPNLFVDQNPVLAGAEVAAVAEAALPRTLRRPGMVQTKEKELDKAAPANARELHLLHVTVRELGTLLGLEVLVLPEIASVLEMIQGQLRLAREFFTMKQVETMMNCCSMALSYAETCGVLQEEGDELLVIYPLSFNIYEVFS